MFSLRWDARVCRDDDDHEYKQVHYCDIVRVDEPERNTFAPEHKGRLGCRPREDEIGFVFPSPPLSHGNLHPFDVMSTRLTIQHLQRKAPGNPTDLLHSSGFHCMGYFSYAG